VELVGTVGARRVKPVDRGHGLRPAILRPDKYIAVDRADHGVRPSQDRLRLEHQRPVTPFEADGVGRGLTLRERAKRFGEGFLILRRFGSDEASET
jgi:hypothetical protein